MNKNKNKNNPIISSRNHFVVLSGSHVWGFTHDLTIITSLKIIWWEKKEKTNPDNRCLCTDSQRGIMGMAQGEFHWKRHIASSWHVPLSLMSAQSPAHVEPELVFTCCRRKTPPQIQSSGALRAAIIIINLSNLIYIFFSLKLFWYSLKVFLLCLVFIILGSDTTTNDGDETFRDLSSYTDAAPDNLQGLHRIQGLVCMRLLNLHLFMLYYTVETNQMMVNRLNVLHYKLNKFRY